ncbi:response regulator [Candidatus Nomurabacteria bacterium]|nr:response regulator [Candidatus Nomurabacteria bacterium]
MEGEKKKILIVDDDNFLLDMYALKFSQNNFEVYTATSGVHALEKLKNGLSPDLLLMDIIMPEMNGFEAMQKMNDEKLCANCLKVVLSNKSEQKDIEEGNRLGVAGYIVKANSTPAEVIEQVVKILETKKAQNHGL